MIPMNDNKKQSYNYTHETPTLTWARLAVLFNLILVLLNLLNLILCLTTQ